MSQEQMQGALERQRTRGLAISPASQGGTPAATESSATQVSLPTVPKEDQVNINIRFDFDSAALREDQKPKLRVLCNAVKGAEVQMLRILGHTDASGTASYNQRLSKLRAEEVKRFLVSDCGLAADQLEAVGVGERFPYDEENPRADVNRRVEFQALG